MKCREMRNGKLFIRFSHCEFFFFFQFNCQKLSENFRKKFRNFRKKNANFCLWLMQDFHYLLTKNGKLFIRLSHSENVFPPNFAFNI